MKVIFLTPFFLLVWRGLQFPSSPTILIILCSCTAVNHLFDPVEKPCQKMDLVNMNLLLDYLGRLPQRDLRAIATRIGVRKADSNRKQAWVLAVHRFQLAPDAPAFMLDLLSPSALEALNRLLGVDALPTALFLAEYGPIRRAGVNRSWSPSPWQQPASVSEELYYAGLLFPVDPKPIERSRQVAVPPDLRRHLAPQVATLRMTQARPFPLLHDLAQVLFYLHQHPDLVLQHGRWLSPFHVTQLNQRLLNSDPPPLPTSHKRTHRLRFLFFLAQSAGLLVGSEVTAFAWFWVAEPPAQQITLLWQAWLGASTDLRRFYVQPGSYLPAPWPHLLVKQLAEIPMPCSPDQLTARILSASPAFQGFFLAYLEDLSQLDDLIADILADPLAQLSVTFAQPDQASPDPDQSVAARRFSLTPTGRWLLQPTVAALPDGLESWPNIDSPGQATLTLSAEEETEGWLLSLGTTVAPHREKRPRHVGPKRAVIESTQPRCACVPGTFRVNPPSVDSRPTSPARTHFLSGRGHLAPLATHVPGTVD